MWKRPNSESEHSGSSHEMLKNVILEYFGKSFLPYLAFLEIYCSCEGI